MIKIVKLDEYYKYRRFVDPSIPYHQQQATGVNAADDVEPEASDTDTTQAQESETNPSEQTSKELIWEEN